MVKASTPPILIVGHAGDLADIRYGCGFTPVDPVIFLETAKEKHLVVPVLEVGRALKEAPLAKIHTPQDLPISQEDRRKFSGWAVGLLKLTGHLHVRVAPFFPAGVAMRLQQEGVKVHIMQEPIYPERTIKSEAEIRCITETQRAAVAAMHVALEEIRAAQVDRKGFLIRHGKKLTSEAVKVAIEIELLNRQCQARDTIVACGAQAADPHDRGTGPLRAGETIVLDIFPQHKGHGYWGDITRTVVKGPARPEIQRLYQAVSKAQQHALKMVKPSVLADGIHAAVQKDFLTAGYVTETREGVPVGFFHGTGHGVGLDIHEDPRVSLTRVRLRKGHVITIEPGLYYPELGGVRIEDTVVVTRDSMRILCPCEKVLEV